MLPAVFASLVQRSTPKRLLSQMASVAGADCPSKSAGNVSRSIVGPVVGNSGITWIHRWALTKGMAKSFYAGEPEVPAFVTEILKP